MLSTEAGRVNLLYQLEERLGIVAGMRYQRAVRKCLNGDLESGEGGDALIQMRFAREVTCVLAAMLGERAQ